MSTEDEEIKKINNFEGLSDAELGLSWTLPNPCEITVTFFSGRTSF